MERRFWLKLAITLILPILGYSRVEGAADSTKGNSPRTFNLQLAHEVDKTVDSNYIFVIEVRHRVFADFKEVDTARFNEKFEIGDGEEVAQIFTFNPHLAITEKGEFLQISDTLYNPAVRIRVYEKDSVVQESWAFYFTDAPHFRRSDMLGFRLLDFKLPDKFIRVEKPPIPEGDSTIGVEKKNK